MTRMICKFNSKKNLKFEVENSDGSVATAAGQHEALRVRLELEPGHGVVVAPRAPVNDTQGAPGALLAPGQHVYGAALQPRSHHVSAGQHPGGRGHRGHAVGEAEEVPDLGPVPGLPRPPHHQPLVPAGREEVLAVACPGACPDDPRYHRPLLFTLPEHLCPHTRVVPLHVRSNVVQRPGPVSGDCHEFGGVGGPGHLRHCEVVAREGGDLGSGMKQTQPIRGFGL